MQASGGRPPPPVRRRYVDCNERILMIIDNFPNMVLIRYLRSIAHNLSVKIPRTYCNRLSQFILLLDVLP